MKKDPRLLAEARAATSAELIELKARWSTDLGLGKNPVAQHGAPLSFSANLESILPGQTQVMDTSALANGYRTPYFIDEIRIQAYMVNTATTTVQPSRAIQLQFRTGAYAFSNVPVPLILHQPVYNVNSNALSSSFTGGAARIGDEARWALPKPLWMAPGDQIQCSVLRDPTAASNANEPFAVDVTYVGRSLKPGTPGPKTRYVPWIAHYLHDFDDVYSQTTTQFRNPFMKPLIIQRLIGRPLSKATSGVFLTARTNMLPNATGTEYPSIYMEDSLGYKITRDFMPAGAIFDSSRCVWTFSRPIGPREQLNMQFRTAGTVDAANRLFGVAMHAYREEEG